MDVTGKYTRVVVEKPDGTLIPEEEPVFILRAQDILAPIAVRYYAQLLLAATGDLRHAKELEVFADHMVSWPTRKLPDTL